MELAAGQTVHFYIFEKDYTAEVVAVRGRWFRSATVRRRDGVVMDFYRRGGVWSLMGNAVLFDGVGPTERRKAERRAVKARRRELQAA